MPQRVELYHPPLPRGLGRVEHLDQTLHDLELAAFTGDDQGVEAGVGLHREHPPPGTARLPLATPSHPPRQSRPLLGGRDLIGEALHGLCNLRRLSVFQLKDANGQRLARLRRVKLGHQPLDLCKVLIGGRQEQRVAVAVADDRHLPRLLAPAAPGGGDLRPVVVEPLERRRHRRGVGQLEDDRANLELAGRRPVDLLQHFIDLVHDVVGSAHQQHTRRIVGDDERRGPTRLVRADHDSLEKLRRLLRLGGGELDQPQRVAVLAELAVQVVQQHVHLGQLLGRRGHQQRVGPLVGGKLRRYPARAETPAETLKTGAEDCAQGPLQVAGLGVLQRVELQRRLDVQGRLVQQFDETVDETDRLRRTHDDQRVGLGIG